VYSVFFCLFSPLCNSPPPPAPLPLPGLSHLSPLYLFLLLLFSVALISLFVLNIFFFRYLFSLLSQNLGIFVSDSLPVVILSLCLNIVIFPLQQLKYAASPAIQTELTQAKLEATNQDPCTCRQGLKLLKSWIRHMLNQ
jgi:hypothetical protein